MAAIDFNNHFPARLRIMSDHLDHPDRHPDHKRGLARAVVRPTLQAARVALDVLLPPQCLACDALVSAPGTLCYACWDGAVFVSAPRCAACGTPFEFDHGPDALCGSCMRDRPRIDRARAVFVYNDVSRNLATGLKYRDRTHAAPALGGGWLARAGRELLGNSDLIAPVPLHRGRLWRRRFNQSGLLAQAVAKNKAREGAHSVSRELGLYLDLLTRVRATPSQGGLNAAARRRNVRGVFSVNVRHREVIAGARILLIDDVFTTGATLGACVAALLGSGAAAVDALVLARVERPR
jgi:ComF family protein